MRSISLILESFSIKDANITQNPAGQRGQDDTASCPSSWCLGLSQPQWSCIAHFLLHKHWCGFFWRLPAALSTKVQSPYHGLQGSAQSNSCSPLQGLLPTTLQPHWPLEKVPNSSPPPTPCTCSLSERVPS